jgi:hypothetical protein
MTDTQPDVAPVAANTPAPSPQMPAPAPSAPSDSRGGRRAGPTITVNKGAAKAPPVDAPQMPPAAARDVSDTPADSMDGVKMSIGKDQETKPFTHPKYKTPEDLAKAYENLEKKFHESRQAVPEQYDLKSAFETAGYSWADADSEAVMQEFEPILAELKEDGFTQAQLNRTLKLAREKIEAELERIYPTPQREAEQQKLMQKWGAETPERARKAIDTFKQKFGDTVASAPLWQTAEGIEFMEKALAALGKAVPLTNTNSVTPKASAAEIRAQMEELAGSKDYYDNRSKQLKLQELAGKLEELRQNSK